MNNMAITAKKSKTILQIAEENSVEIPTLCNSDDVGIMDNSHGNGSCGICMVEVEGNPRLVRACSTIATDGMIIRTESARIRSNRRLVTELLLSDHTGDCKPPCALACPADSDCMGYIRLIAEGDFAGAAANIREKVPFAATIGRICPRPCESACRRKLVEESLAIADLKRFAANYTATNTAANVTDSADSAAANIAVIGGGPGGLSAAYYLRQNGHNVTVYEAMPQLGGMLRYGVPQFRLPDEILQKEVDLIGESGVKFICNKRVRLEELRGDYDVIIVAIGAWKAIKLNLPDEISATEYLQSPMKLRGNVCVIGGGNTAMDACRTAVRAGSADSVYCVYRRTREEMPAEPHEIKAAEDEGVIFMFSTTYEQLPAGFADTIITAVGNKPDLSGFEGLEFGDNYRTNIDNVFAVGDLLGTDIAAKAIGDGRKCAEIVHRFVKGEQWAEIERDIKPKYLVKSDKTAADYTDCIKKAREIPEKICADEKAAMNEARRCLECGCQAYVRRSCRLYWYANLYGVDEGNLGGEKHDHKCILCGLCVRTHEDVAGFVNRGFDTAVNLYGGIGENDAGICPTGALYDKLKGI
jgi:formate dehydrogenase major subunit